MSDGSDPNAVVSAMDRARDAFDEVGFGVPEYEPGIDTDADWKTQLTKGCRLLDVVSLLDEDGPYYIATIELCFAAIERSIEAYGLAMGGDDLSDYRDHTHCYERAAELGLFTAETAAEIEGLYDDNRTESYYGGRRPSEEQAAAMNELAAEIHAYVVDQIREGGVCRCR